MLAVTRVCLHEAIKGICGAKGMWVKTDLELDKFEPEVSLIRKCIVYLLWYSIPYYGRNTLKNWITFSVLNFDYQ